MPKRPFGCFAGYKKRIRIDVLAEEKMFLLSYDDTKTEVCQGRNRDSPNLQNLVGFPFWKEKCGIEILI